MASQDNLKEKQEFWKAVFQQSELTQQLMDLKGSDLTHFQFELSGIGEVHVTAKPAVPLGTNFMSDVFTVQASLENAKHTGFVKILPSNSSRLAAGFIGGSYHRETIVYNQWLPELRKIRFLKHLTNSDIPLNVANAYYVNLALSSDGNSLEKETVCVLEDLKSKGYRMSTSARTAAGIDLTHAEVAIRTYANYHALSIANFRRYKNDIGFPNAPSCYEVFRKDPNYIHPASVYRNIVLPSYSKILRYFHKNEAADWLDGLIPELEKIWNWESFVDSGILTCLLHGDSWNNNILFRYPNENSEQPEEMLLIDWQIARYGHPSHDLGYFFFSSTSSAFRRKHLDTLFKEYYAVLKTALSKLSIDLDDEGYSREKFIDETKQRYILMMMIAFFILPILLDSSKAEDHTLKDQDISKSLTNDKEDVSQAEKLDEEGTKRGWESLFDLETVVTNPILSQRIVELVIDVMELTCSE